MTEEQAPYNSDEEAAFKLLAKKKWEQIAILCPSKEKLTCFANTSLRCSFETCPFHFWLFKQ